ncbi:WYL domain-containing protein [Pseudomonas sp. DR48]|nr:WYL domain-containing protein [Pseudomonas sp. DR48]
MATMTNDVETTPNTPPRAGARWGQERRLEFIDYRLHWDGHLNRSDLTSFFGISVPQSSLDLAEYIKRAPGNLTYDTSTKVYRAPSSFQALFASSSLERYLEDLLRATVSPEGLHGSFLGWYPPVATVPRPWRRLDVTAVIAVVKAIRQHEALTIRYQSFSSATPSVRVVTPHALVNNGFRWHMRAYCHTNDDFRDFLLSRVLEIEKSKIDQERASADRAWHNMVRLVLAPHPELESGHRKVIELDFGMTEGECSFECRQALLFYALQQLGLDQPDSGKSAKAQQIILNNRDELAEFLPKTSYR